MLVTLLLTRLDIVKNSYCYQGGSSIMQALQISHLNINPLITLLPSPQPQISCCRMGQNTNRLIIALLLVQSVWWIFLFVLL